MVKNDGKKLYSRLEISITEYKEFDVVRTSDQPQGMGTYDANKKEWYDSDVQWGDL